MAESATHKQSNKVWTCVVLSGQFVYSPDTNMKTKGVVYLVCFIVHFLFSSLPQNYNMHLYICARCCPGITELRAPRQSSVKCCITHKSAAISIISLKSEPAAAWHCPERRRAVCCDFLSCRLKKKCKKKKKKERKKKKQSKSNRLHESSQRLFGTIMQRNTHVKKKGGGEKNVI